MWYKEDLNNIASMIATQCLQLKTAGILGPGCNFSHTAKRVNLNHRQRHGKLASLGELGNPHSKLAPSGGYSSINFRKVFLQLGAFHE